jgi:uncharacterized membrane protein
MTLEEKIIRIIEIILRLLVVGVLYHISKQLKEIAPKESTTGQFLSKFYLPAIILIIIILLVVVLEIPSALLGH